MGFKYSVGMKCRVLAPYIAAAFLLVGIATAQNKPATEKKDPLPLVKVASNIAVNSQQQDLDGFLAVYVDPESWASALKDGDLGPFLKVKEQKPGRSAVLFFPANKETGICVFFDGDSPVGVTAAKAKNGKIEAGDISAGYKPLAKEMLNDTGQEYVFSKGDLATDDGQPLEGFQVTRASKKPAN
jgi:hypothetical protein